MEKNSKYGLLRYSQNEAKRNFTSELSFYFLTLFPKFLTAISELSNISRVPNNFNYTCY